MLILSNRTTLMPNGESIIVSESDYNNSLREVISLSHDGVANFNVGDDVDQKQKDDLHRAIKILDNMNEFKQTEAAGYFEAGLLYYIVGDSDTAKQRILQALSNAQLTPNLTTAAQQANLEGVLADAHHILGLIAFDHHDYNTAMQEVDLALDHVKKSHLIRPNIYVCRARVELELKKTKQAQEDIEAALASDPNSPQALRLKDFIQH
ncbi:MAG: hypothetical protein P4L46_08880 [Fimbriimonas sp.]|nr:hypothetical protein [Fimbriimonas sp.]